MSKELEALKEVRECLYGDVYAGVEKRLDIIETALKRLNMYENVVGIERIQDTNKKLKALEIIKEIFNLRIYEKQGQFFICSGVNGETPISKEKAMLLKEVEL